MDGANVGDLSKEEKLVRKIMGEVGADGNGHEI